MVKEQRPHIWKRFETTSQLLTRIHLFHFWLRQSWMLKLHIFPGLSQDSKVLGGRKGSECVGRNPIPHGDPMWFWCWKIPAIRIVIPVYPSKPIPWDTVIGNHWDEKKVAIFIMVPGCGKSHGRIQHWKHTSTEQIYSNPDGKVGNLEMWGTLW